MSDRPQPARITGGLGHGFFTLRRLGLVFLELLVRVLGTKGSTCLWIGHLDVTADRPPWTRSGHFERQPLLSLVGMIEPKSYYRLGCLLLRFASVSPPRPLRSGHWIASSCREESRGWPVTFRAAGADLSAA